jgi:hypothetical protein
MIMDLHDRNGAFDTTDPRNSIHSPHSGDSKFGVEQLQNQKFVKVIN